jgi:hypothetical protein
MNQTAEEDEKKYDSEGDEGDEGDECDEKLPMAELASEKNMTASDVSDIYNMVHEPDIDLKMIERNLPAHVNCSAKDLWALSRLPVTRKLKLDILYGIINDIDTSRSEK